MSVLPIEDYKIAIEPTAALINFIKTKLQVSESSPENILKIKSRSKNSKDCKLLVKDIKWLNEQLIEYRKLFEEEIYLNDLLDKTNISLPQPTIVPRNPVLDARVKKLIVQEKQREYAAITKNVDAVRKFYPEDTIAYQMKQINKQLIAVAQFVLSIITGFVFGFLGIELIIGNLDFGIRLLLGVMIALTVALAEIYFLAKKLNEDYYYETSLPDSYTKLHAE